MIEMRERLPIPSAPGYEACEDGHVWRNGTRRKPISNGRGYLKIKLSIENVQRDAYVHRLVCEAFHGPCPPGLQCRHLNGNRSDNRPTNVEWASKAVNEADKVAHGTISRGEMCTNAVLTEAVVVEARRRVAAGERLDHLAAEFGVGRAVLGDAVRGHRWKHIPGACRPRDRFRRFTPCDVAHIRAMTEKVADLARHYGVHKNAIVQVRKRETYTDLP